MRIYISNLTLFFYTVTSVCKLENRLTNAYGALQSHCVRRKHLRLNKKNKNDKSTTTTSGQWISAGIQAQMYPPPIPLIRAELEEQKSLNIIKI